MVVSLAKVRRVGLSLMVAISLYVWIDPLLCFRLLPHNPAVALSITDTAVAGFTLYRSQHGATAKTDCVALRKYQRNHQFNQRNGLAHSLIFVHGMGEKTSRRECLALYGQIAKAYCDKHGGTTVEFAAKFPMVEVEWQSVTAAAEKALYNVLVSDEPPHWWDVFDPDIPLLRSFMTHYVGDVIAYTAENDNGIRRKVWHDLTVKSHALTTSDYSIVAHSLGATIMFDYLYKLFAKGDPLYDTPATSPADIAAMKHNFRHFFTFGSTIGIFMLRNGTLWKTSSPFVNIVNPVPNAGVWLNFYDQQDILAYPLQRLFAMNPANPHNISDIQVDTGDLVYNSHTQYWVNDDMAEQIAGAL